MSDDETKEIMDDLGLDKEDAERVKELMDEWEIDADDAAELLDEL